MNPEKDVPAGNVPPPRRQFSHDQVAQRAEQIWRERNCPAGSDEAIWLEAESQLQAEAEARPVSGTPARPYTDEPGIPVRSRTRVQDPTEAAVQPRSATQPKPRGQQNTIRSQ